MKTKFNDFLNESYLDIYIHDNILDIYHGLADLYEI